MQCIANSNMSHFRFLKLEHQNFRINLQKALQHLGDISQTTWPPLWKPQIRHCFYP